MADLDLEYLGEMRKTHYSQDLSPELENQEVVIGGWVSRTRNIGGLVFLVLQDKYGTIQVTAKKGVVPDEVFEKCRNIGVQYCVIVRAKVKVFKKAPNGVELVPQELKVLNTAMPELPIDMTGKTMSDLDTRLNNRTLDLRHPRNLAIFRINQEMLLQIRKFLLENHFTEIVTPKIIGSATEGGTELFPLKYFEKDAYLSQSAQLFKERLVSVYERVFEIGAAYRAEKSFTNRHLCEISTLDMEMGFVDYKDVLEIVENMIHAVLTGIKEHCEADLKLLGQWDSFEVPTLPIPRHTYQEILSMLDEKCGVQLQFGEDIPTEAYRKLGEILPGYYYIIKWPQSIKPFYIMHDREDPTLSEGFDLQKGYLELISGGTRVHDKKLLESNIQKQGLSVESFESHLKTFEFGMPPHAGIGMGMARWLQIICGLEQIKEAVMFPRTPDRLDP